jgi:hypothetical protein
MLTLASKYMDSNAIGIAVLQCGSKYRGSERLLSSSTTQLTWGDMTVFNFSNNTNIIVFFLLVDSPASEFYVLTFRNTLSVPSS